MVGLGICRAEMDVVRPVPVGEDKGAGSLASCRKVLSVQKCVDAYDSVLYKKWKILKKVSRIKYELKNLRGSMPNLSALIQMHV